MPPLGLVGDLYVPVEPRGIILFAHGSGSSRLSSRNVAVAEALNAHGFATLLFDLLTPAEAHDRRNVFDIPLLAERVMEAALWISGEPDIADLPLGLFGASTGAGAALLAAAELHDRVAAVVSRGGRPDLRRAAACRGRGAHAADRRRRRPSCPRAEPDRPLAALTCEKLLKIVPGAGHLFEEPGTLETVTEMACAWFQHYLAPAAPASALAAPRAEPVSRQQPVPIVTALRRPSSRCQPSMIRTFATAFDRFASSRVVLLGEASHGTSEFYRARAAITRRLIERHGFTIVAVEADWPDAAAIDRYVRHGPVSADALGALHPLPDLDVAQPGRRRFRGLPAPPQRGQATRRARRVLRPRSLQHDRLDGGRARVSRPGRSGGGGGGARTLRLPHAMVARARGLRPGVAHQRLRALRGAGDHGRSSICSRRS